MTEAIKTVDLGKRYRFADALRGLNLSVPEGSVYGLVGPNGAGKTTTLKILMNLVRADSGTAEALGVESRKLGPRELARIGYVSENQKMPEWMTVAYPMRYLKPFYPQWDDARCAELLRQLDLPPQQKLRHLSRGMRMKAALASSLAYRPQLIVLDEPFTGLDALMRDELIGALLENAEGSTVLISSHDLAEIESFASHIGYLDRGRLECSEEMTALSGRFREIEVTVERHSSAPAELPAPWPASWVAPQSSPNVIRFVETRFDHERTLAEIRRVFGDGCQISVSPMPLRQIFVTLAKSGRKAA